MSAYIPFDTDAHLALHPFPSWVAGSYARGFAQGKDTWTSADKEARQAILSTVAAAVKSWLQTLPLGVEIGTMALAKAMAPCPEEVDEYQWFHVLSNRIGDMRHYGHLDGYWRSVPNKRRPTQPHKKYHNGIPT